MTSHVVSGWIVYAEKRGRMSHTEDQRKKARRSQAQAIPLGMVKNTTAQCGVLQFQYTRVGA